MHIIKPFAPKIIETSPEGRVIHNSIEDYEKNGLKAVKSHTAHYECARCKASHSAKSEFSGDCTYQTKTYDPNSIKDDADITTPWLWRHYVMKSYTHPDGHALVTFVVVKTELGDELIDPEPKPYSPRRGLGSYEYWMESSFSPEYRGQLDCNKGSHNFDFHNKYKHYPTHYLKGYWYRRPKTTNERRQIEACEVDEFAPRIKARRGHNSLPSAWDDIHIYRDKSWKRKKVRKQWAINLPTK